MADQLATLENAQSWFGLAASNTSQNVLLELLIAEASAVITESCNRPWWLLSNGPETLYRSGQDETSLFIDWPVRQPTATGTTTSGSTTVSALSLATGYTSANLFVGQSVRASGIPSGAFVATVESGTVTLSQAATVSASGVALTFGIAVWEDATGTWGQSTEAFGDDPLEVGNAYALRADQPDGLTSKSGMIDRTNGYWRQQYATGGGLASRGIGGVGNYKIVANVGYPLIPADLEMACLRVVSRVRASRRFGQVASGGGYEGANVSFAPDVMAALGVLGGDVAGVLARYRIDSLSLALGAV